MGCATDASNLNCQCENGTMRNSILEGPRLRTPLYSGVRNLWTLLFRGSWWHVPVFNKSDGDPVRNHTLELPALSQVALGGEREKYPKVQGVEKDAPAPPCNAAHLF